MKLLFLCDDEVYMYVQIRHIFPRICNPGLRDLILTG
jgi:hypothetical protein